MSIKFRSKKDTDDNFLYSTILKSYRFSNPIARSQRDGDYYSSQSKCLATLFDREDTKVIIACADEDEDLIVGFIIYESAEPTIHYVYVKAAFRGAKIATALVEKAGLDPAFKLTYYTHWTIDVLRFCTRYKLVYNPMLYSWVSTVKGDSR